MDLFSLKITESEQLVKLYCWQVYNVYMEPLSRDFLLARGYCCNFGCRNCPSDEPANSRTSTRVCTRSIDTDQTREDEGSDS